MSGGTINSGDTLTIDEGTKLTVGNTKAAGMPILSIDGNDTWKGTLDLTPNFSSVSINGATKATTAILNQSGTNVVTTVTGSTFELNNASDSISAGKFYIGDGANTTLVGVKGGTITDAVTTEIRDAATLDIQSGSVGLNVGDTWTGQINLKGGII